MTARSATSLVLARIVAPEAYGLIDMTTALIAVLQSFVDNGLGNALIQKQANGPAPHVLCGFDISFG